MILLLCACGIFDTEPVDSGDSGDTGDSAVDVETVDHCGDIEADETWSAELPHVLSCDVEVVSGTLTIEEGAEIWFDNKSAIKVANGDYAAGLVVQGSADNPVRFVPSSDVSEPSWEGIEIGPLATGVVIEGAEIVYAGKGQGGAILVEDAQVVLSDVTITDSGAAGVYLKGEASLGEGSGDITVSGAAELPVSVSATQAHTVPVGAYSGNGQDYVELRGDTVTESVTWGDLGVPWLVKGNASFSGSAEAAAVLTIEGGTSFVFDQGDGFTFSKDGSASGLFIDGSAEAPVSLGPLGASQIGYWRGLQFEDGVVQAELHHTTISWGGSAGGGLAIDGVEVLVDHVTIVGAEDAGVQFRGGGRLHADSAALVVEQSDTAISTTADALGTLPVEGSSYSGNERDVIVIEKDGEVTDSATWHDLGVPYEVDVTVEVDGTAEAPAILTIEAGTTFRFGNDRGLYVSKNKGAAGLRIEGTEDAPVVMGPRDTNSPGAWSGVGFWSDAEADECVLEWVEITAAGGKTLDGNVHVDSVAATLTSLVLDDSEQFGLYIEGPEETWPVTTDITGEGNLEGLVGYAE